MARRSKQWRWKRVRPGLYHLVDMGDDVHAEVERGGETGRWYGIHFLYDYAFPCAAEDRLVDAQRECLACMPRT